MTKKHVPLAKDFKLTEGILWAIRDAGLGDLDPNSKDYPENIVIALVRSHALHLRLQQKRRHLASQRVKRVDDLIAALSILADCCGRREQCFNLSSNVLGITFANIFRTVSDQLRQLTLSDRGLLEGQQAHLEQDPLLFLQKPVGDKEEDEPEST